jgi:hypothetical protein
MAERLRLRDECSRRDHILGQINGVPTMSRLFSAVWKYKLPAIAHIGT